MISELTQLAAENGTRLATRFWGWDVALEMFLAGTAGALMLIAIFRRKHDAPLHRAALACLIAAGALLWFDLGAKHRVFQFYLSWRPDSVMFWGSWIFALAAAAAALSAIRPPAAPLRIAGGVLGAGLMVYPGLLLSSMTARDAWNSAWVPVLFAVLSLSSGVAALCLIDAAARRYRRWVPAAAACVLASAFLARAAVLFAGQQ